MTNIVTAAVNRLEAEGWAAVYAWRLWRAPDPGQAATVISTADDWAALRTTAQAPILRVQVYATNSEGQADAEGIALEVTDRIRGVLHRPQGGAERWGDLRILSSMNTGSGMADREDADGVVRSLVFEVQTG